MRKYLFYIYIPFFLSIQNTYADNEGKYISSANAQIRFDKWNEKTQAWEKTYYKSKFSDFELYKLEPEINVHQETPIVKDSSTTLLSLDKTKLFITRIIYDDVYSPEGIVTTENSYCDMLDLNTGCIMLTRSGDYCSGQWSNYEWVTEQGESIGVELETLSPQNILSTINQIKNKNSRTDFIKESMYMGVKSYLACYPIDKSNVQSFNDIAFYMAQGGDIYIAMQIYRELEVMFPNRIVLMLNIADVLWQDKQYKNAGFYYEKYKNSMIKNGLINKIPSRVIERAK